ncbi:CHAD domain-containing protein [Pseudomonas silvicola]|nr:CHAD domain-containing protein [Pseudomonas silvicola]
MSKLLDEVIAHLVGIEIRLLACQARLEAHTDPEALHDLRTTVRRLRSLTRPLRGLPGVDQLEEAAKGVGQLTTPYRDREVLAAHLHTRGHQALAQRRVAQMRGVYPQVAASAELARLVRILDGFPRFARAAQREKLLGGLHKRVDKRLGKQWRQLEEALQDPGHDRHRLRLLIKRVRYGVEAYPALSRASEPLVKRLRQAQGALGDWHDNWQWLLQVEQEPDLLPCLPEWQAALVKGEQRSDRALDKLLAALKH